MVKEQEGTFETGGASLYTKSWLPDDEQEPPRAKMIFIHGFSDHVGRYYGFFPYLASRGIAVHAFDQRGWGRSMKKPADRGATGPTSQVLSDMAAFVARHLPPASEGGGAQVPVFVMGHSMGGGQVLHLAMSKEHKDVTGKVRGWLLETPFLGFSKGEEPSVFKVLAGRWVGRILPKQHMVHKIPLSYMSRDEQVAKDMEEDPMCHDTGTLEGLAGTLDRAIALESGQVRPEKGQFRSLGLWLGSEDKAVSYEASKKWFEGLGDEVEDKEMKVYPEWRHCLHAEIGKEEFYKDVAEWILARSGEEEGGKAKL